jgi:geranylgeranyl diphosphate synthase type II
MRPALFLLSHQLFSSDLTAARNAALAIEVFHNFTLMHDDIMDNAPLRRGQATVHEKFNTNKAILSGDAMLIQAYQLLMSHPCQNQIQLIHCFNQHAMEVCEGQELDMNFESREDVTIEEYIEMIRLKTAVLIGGSMKMGAIYAGAQPEEQEHLYQCGEEMGIAFQLLDDYLDAFGDPHQVGKQLGGDIIADKKTFLRIHLYQKATPEELTLLQKKDILPQEKVTETLGLLRKYHIDHSLLDLAKKYSDSAIAHLDAIELKTEYKAPLQKVITDLLNRTS